MVSDVAVIRCRMILPLQVSEWRFRRKRQVLSVAVPRLLLAAAYKTSGSDLSLDNVWSF